MKGATRWLSLGIFNLQPSEITKFTMMLFLASYRSGDLKRCVKNLVVCQTYGRCRFIAILLLMEPDYGTLLVLSCAVMGVLLLAGAPFTQYMVFGSALFLGLAILAVIEPYRMSGLRQFLILGRSFWRGLPTNASVISIWSRGTIWNGTRQFRPEVILPTRGPH